MAVVVERECRKGCWEEGEVDSLDNSLIDKDALPEPHVTCLDRTKYLPLHVSFTVPLTSHS